MFEACEKAYDSADVIVMSAAVADYTISKKADEKIKKSDTSINIELKSTKDILKFLGENKKPNQVLVGFALETNNELEHAKSKLKRKNLDLIILNSLRDPGAGFGTDTNRIVILDKDNNQKAFELKSKQDVAIDIINSIEDKLG
jgi:phosphopantothenoylcysteine decarboxylase/phosphopantothenate--cysteine ligase